MSSPILYVTDLDGTLLDAEGWLSLLSRQQLESLLSQGVLFTVASARSLVSIKERLGDLPLTLPVIEFNGAYVSDYRTGEKLITHALLPQTVMEIQEVMLRERSVHFVSTHDGMEDHVYYGSDRNGGMDYYLQERVAANDPRLRLTSDWQEIQREEVVCFTVVGDERRLSCLRDMLAERFGAELTMHLWDDTYATGWYWLMIHHRNACKGKAIQRLRKLQGLNEHQLTVFGDQVNDLGMMAVADRKVAVANAAVEVLAVADLVLEPHHMDPVSRFILEELGL